MISRRVLLLPPEVWDQNMTKRARKSVADDGIEIDTGAIEPLLAGVDAMLVVLDGGSDPGMLRRMGEAARKQRVEILYASPTRIPEVLRKHFHG